MLWNFASDEQTVYLYAPKRWGNGNRGITARRLRQGQSFHGLTYAELKAADNGALRVEGGVGRILRPDEGPPMPDDERGADSVHS